MIVIRSTPCLSVIRGKDNPAHHWEHLISFSCNLSIFAYFAPFHH